MHAASFVPSDEDATSFQYLPESVILGVQFCPESVEV
jgi:hypothetical protein